MLNCHHYGVSSSRSNLKINSIFLILYSSNLFRRRTPVISAITEETLENDIETASQETQEDVSGNNMEVYQQGYKNNMYSTIADDLLIAFD